MLRLLTAPQRDSAEAGPYVFLAGPIQFGGQAWQERAIALLHDGDFCIANPRRPGFEALSDKGHAEQVDWETDMLRRAGDTGVVLFWLAAERHHRCDRAHAQTTRFELAEWKERHRVDGARLVVGIEEGFTGARYIRRRFTQDCPRVPLASSLEEACAHVLRLMSETARPASGTARAPSPVRS